ncbi:aldose epimerase family protein [Celeribacter sp. ULVN23_4]
MKALFGHLSDGRRVDAITLTAGELTVSVLTYGAILNDVRLRGVPYGLTLGSTEIATYENGPMEYFGALVGPVANRISNARATLEDRDLSFAANEAGTTTLHGGPNGMHTELWSLDAFSDTSVTLTLSLPDGKGGFPGNRQIMARYTVEAPATLRLELSATTDAPTFMNLANHSYWRLDDSATTDGHWLQVFADHYLPVDGQMIPTEVAEVTGTGFDLRDGRVLRPSDAQRYDHNFCLPDQPGAMKAAAILRGTSGVTLRVDTTEPGLQVFDAAPIGSGTSNGHRGVPEVGFCGVALEAQHWPDAPNRPEFPSVRLNPNAIYKQETRWRFTKK